MVAQRGNGVGRGLNNCLFNIVSSRVGRSPIDVRGGIALDMAQNPVMYVSAIPQLAMGSPSTMLGGSFMGPDAQMRQLIMGERSETLDKWQEGRQNPNTLPENIQETGTELMRLTPKKDEFTYETLDFE